METMKRTQSKTEVNINHNSCLIFKHDVTKVLYTPRMKNPSLLANFTNPFAFIIHEVLTICFDFTNTRHVILGKFSAKQRGRSRCHVWIQYGPYTSRINFLLFFFFFFFLLFLFIFFSDNQGYLIHTPD